MYKNFIIILFVFFMGINCAYASDDYDKKVQELAKFITLSDVVYLSSVDENGWPSDRVMFNLRNKKFPINLLFENDSLGNIFITSGKSSKVQHFLKNNKAGTLYYNPRLNSRSLFIEGEMEVIEDKKEKAKYINEENLINLPFEAVDQNMTLLKFNPKRVKSYYRGKIDIFDVR